MLRPQSSWLLSSPSWSCNCRSASLGGAGEKNECNCHSTLLRFDCAKNSHKYSTRCLDVLQEAMAAGQVAEEDWKLEISEMQDKLEVEITTTTELLNEAAIEKTITEQKCAVTWSQYFQALYLCMFYMHP